VDDHGLQGKPDKYDLKEKKDTVFKILELHGMVFLSYALLSLISVFILSRHQGNLPHLRPFLQNV
jgi:hypothetical protein